MCNTAQPFNPVPAKYSDYATGLLGEGGQHPLHPWSSQSLSTLVTTFFRRFFNMGFPSATFAFRAFALNPIRIILNENYSICKWNSICIHIHASCQDQNPFNQAPYCRYERKKAKRQNGNQQLSDTFPCEPQVEIVYSQGSD